MASFNHMAWLHEREANVRFQNLGGGARPKNAVIVTFACFNTVRSVGGASLIHAVQKAAIQFDLAKMAHENCLKKSIAESGLS